MNLTQRNFQLFFVRNISLYFTFNFGRRSPHERIANLILTERLLHSTRKSTEFEKLSGVVGFKSYSIASSSNVEKCSSLASTISLTL